MDRSDQASALGRRDFLRTVAATGALTGAGGLLAACSSGSGGSAGSSPSVTPGGPKKGKRGGDLKVGLTGGSSSDTLDPHKGLTYLDTARAQALYEPLVAARRATPRSSYVLAEEITPHTAPPPSG